jgi:hypothetical protein
MTVSDFEAFALRIAPAAASVANYCDHVEHNEFADRMWVLESSLALREAASAVAISHGISLHEAYAERLGEIEARNVLARPGGYDGHHSALEARTWRDLQLVQVDHDRNYHPDVAGMAKAEQLRHIALHLAKIVGAFAEPREADELLRKRLPDTLLFSIKLATLMGSRLSEEPLDPSAADRTALEAARTTA